VYIGCEPSDVCVQASGLRDGWIYMMAYHVTMNPAGARELAERLLLVARTADGGAGEHENAALAECMACPKLAEQREAAHAQNCEAEVARRIAGAVSAAMAMVRMPGVFVVPACAQCNARPAACVGCYDSDGIERPACDECCGHGCEDGTCRPLDARDWSTAGPVAPGAEPEPDQEGKFMTWRSLCRRLVQLALTDGALAALDARVVIRVESAGELYCGGIGTMNVDIGCGDAPALMIDGDDGE
jgi:hypothetical protein